MSLLEKLQSKYGGMVDFTRTSLKGNGERLFRDILSRIPTGGTAVETGTHNGFSALLLSEYFDVVHTFDIRNSTVKDDVWKEFEVSNKIHFWLIDNDVQKESIVSELKFDFAFIDGNHRTGLETDFRILNKCGKVLFHDYQPDSENLVLLHMVAFIEKLEGLRIKMPPFAYWSKENV